VPLAADLQIPVDTSVLRKALPNSVAMKLVLIKPGKFLMGSPDTDQDAANDEKPQHLVQITRPFYLGAHEVTQGQYRVVTRAAPSSLKGSDELPMDKVSWNDAITFCNRLSEMESLKPCYEIGGGLLSGGDGYRLPTEAEWEYACRAGSTTRYCFGDETERLGEFAWHLGNSERRTHPVGQRTRPNAWGLHGMHGNVFEWCWDWYDGSYYQEPPGADPPGPSRGTERVVRGGGWNSPAAQACRSASRAKVVPTKKLSTLGFRVVRVRLDR
jgi:formylglycine-generating enzyme required for sulfatase activity